MEGEVESQNKEERKEEEEEEGMSNPCRGRWRCTQQQQ
jgi:hypothetical protein